jgi:protein CpxP
MDFFQKPKLLTITIIGLFILNLATLGYLWFSRPHGILQPRNMNPPLEQRGGFLEEQLKLNDKQKDEFLKLKEEHHKLAEPLQDSIHILKDRMFDVISSGQADTIKASEIARSIGECQKQLEMVAFHHFRKMRDLCDDNQKQKFDKVMKNVMMMVGPGEMRMQPPMGREHGLPPPRDIPPPNDMSPPGR